MDQFDEEVREVMMITNSHAKYIKVSRGNTFSDRPNICFRLFF